MPFNPEFHSNLEVLKRVKKIVGILLNVIEVNFIEIIFFENYPDAGNVFIFLPPCFPSRSDMERAAIQPSKHHRNLSVHRHIPTASPGHGERMRLGAAWFRLSAPHLLRHRSVRLTKVHANRHLSARLAKWLANLKNGAT